MSLTVSDGFPYYIELTGTIPAKTLLTDPSLETLLDSITEEKSKHRYADGKWSIKQIVGHIVDHERIMAYRTLRFSRKDKTTLPGYDQNLMVDNAYFNEFSFSQLVQDYKLVRASTVSFMNLLKPEQMKLTGMAWKFELTVDEMFRAIVGHEMHHIKILKERYLQQ
ncbi:MAG: DinB family protein [Chryseolinea sp.]